MMSNIYTLDNQTDFQAVCNQYRSHVALIGKGKSRSQFKFNLSTTVCFWVNPITWKDMVYTIYGEVDPRKHIACISGYHPDLVEKFHQENPEIDVLTFSLDGKQNDWHVYGAYPAFSHYASLIVEKSGKLLYLTGCEMNTEPPENRSFMSEIEGMKKLYFDVKDNRYYRILKCIENIKIGFHTMTYDELIQDENIHIFPEAS